MFWEYLIHYTKIVNPNIIPIVRIFHQKDAAIIANNQKYTI